MFKKGELVIYRSVGVCEIVDITTMNLDGAPKDRLYYVLHPYYQKEGKIFTPVDNKKAGIRKVISKDEADKLVHDIPVIDHFWIAEDKQREEKYKECIRSGDLRELVRILKTLFLRREKRMEQGKKITATDEKYLRIAEECFYSELSISFGIPKEEVEDYITSRIESISLCEK